MRTGKITSSCRWEAYPNERRLWDALENWHFSPLLTYGNNFGMRGRNMFWHSLIPFWDYLSDFLPLLSHSPPWLWWSRFSMIVWSTTSPQIKHRQLKKGPFEPKNSSWIIIPLHRSHFTFTSPKLSPWDQGDWNKNNIPYDNLLSFLWRRKDGDALA